jgi:excisionase family DNA binding protein
MPNPENSSWPLFKPKEVAMLLGVSVRQVLRLPIPQVRFGPRTIRYRKEDVDAFIQENTTTN